MEHPNAQVSNEQCTPVEHNVLPVQWNKRIPSDKNVLAELHSSANWIPGDQQIRPSSVHLQAKANEMINIERFYESTNDYIYDLVFNYETIVGSSGKLVSNVPLHEEERHKDGVLLPNSYPYQLDQGSHHYVIWYSHGRNEEGDVKINNDIYQALLSQLGHDRFEFVWYENPKMTVPEIYHVQVFWHET